MIREKIPAAVLSTKVIANVAAPLLGQLCPKEQRGSFGLISTDCDDVSYVALDEATKKADVRVAYAKSLYAGASNASTRLAGEFLGILAGPDPEEVKSGLAAACEFMQTDAAFQKADDAGTVVYFSHCISRTGSFLSKEAGVPEGTPMAYLIAPPTEALYGLDAALKAAEVELRVFYGPPTETNFAGGLLTGSQCACKAACEAFEEAVIQVAAAPLDIL